MEYKDIDVQKPRFFVFIQKVGFGSHLPPAALEPPSPPSLLHHLYLLFFLPPPSPLSLPSLDSITPPPGNRHCSLVATFSLSSSSHLLYSLFFSSLASLLPLQPATLIPPTGIVELSISHTCKSGTLQCRQWQEKASGFFQSSGVKLKEAGQSARAFAGAVAKDAKGSVADVAEKVGSVVKSQWLLFQQPSTRHAMQERFITAAATTSLFLRKGFSETKYEVTVGKTKAEEVAKKTAQKSQTLLNTLRQFCPCLLRNELTKSSLSQKKKKKKKKKRNSQELFKSEGDKKVIQHLVSLYNQGTQLFNVIWSIQIHSTHFPDPAVILCCRPECIYISENL